MKSSPNAKQGGTNVTMHDGSVIHFSRVPDNYDVSDRMAAMQYLREHPAEVVTGILYAMKAYRICTR